MKRWICWTYLGKDAAWFSSLVFLTSQSKLNLLYHCHCVNGHILKMQYVSSMEGGEGDMAVNSGDYLLVWMDPNMPIGPVLDAETLDGRRGLVPTSYCSRLVGDDLLEFHQVYFVRLFRCINFALNIV